MSEASRVRRPRVAVVRHGEYPKQPHCRRDVAALVEAGFDVDVICDSEPGLPHFERLEGVTVIRVPTRHKRGGLVRYLFEYAAMPVLAAGALAMRSFPRGYDYVEIDTMPTWLIAAAIVPKLMGATVVLYMFEHMGELWASDRDVSEDHPVARFLTAIEMLCVRAADVVLTPAERHRERFIQKGIARDKVIFIPNGPDEEVFLRSAYPVTSPPKAGDEFRLVTHGSMLERYGIQTLTEAVAQLRERIPGITLRIIGSGEYEVELQAQVERLDLSDRVAFVGPVEFEEMASQLLGADLGVAPYWLDLLANKVMEYLLLGIPTIASDWPTMRRYFGDDAITYVEPRDPEALAKAIEELYRNPEHRIEQGERGQRQYRDTLAWSRAKRTYLSVYGDAQSTAGQAAAEESKTAKGWLSFVLGQSRGPRNALTRIPTIVSRFGLTPRKSKGHLDRLLRVTERHSVRATLPVTAVTARRNPDVIQSLRDRGVEVAAHGYVHNDYASLSREQQFEQVLRARDELAALGFPVRGWRCPYSRWNEDTVDAIRSAGFEYDATPVYVWPAFEQENIAMTPAAAEDYDRLRRLFRVRDAERRAVLPSTIDGLVRIPMSIPQDEDMVDRLHLSTEEMTRVWLRMLTDSRRRKETLVICLHPERAALCEEPLDALLASARQTADVWIQTQAEIARWWKERSLASVNVTPDGSDGRWTIESTASERVCISSGKASIQGSGRIEIDLPRKPVIGHDVSWPEASLQRLQEAGYVTETGSEVTPGSCMVYLNERFAPETDPEEMIRTLDSESDRLVRIEPWPTGFRSCMSITGDIDAITLFDFAMRLKEFS